MDAAIAQLTDENIRAGKSGLLLIADNHDALATRILSARSAVRTLDLMYYIWHDDHTGRLLLNEVIAAADRGVVVRMLIDDINPQASDATYLALDRHPNIELKLFNPSRWRNGSWLRPVELLSRVATLTRRMHTKAWIADGDVAIVGGRNIGDAYFDAADTNFRDLDLLLMGHAVGQTAAIFERFWKCREAKPVKLLHRSRGHQPAPNGHVDSGMELSSLTRGYRSIKEFLATRGDIHWTERARVIADPPQKVRGRRYRNWLMRELMPLIQAAEHKLEIVSPYFIPGRKGTAVLKQLVRRGVDATVLTNSLDATDVAAVHGAYMNYRVSLLKHGVKLFELQRFDRRRDISVFGSKGASLHTKSFIVDGRIAFVGSFNFDPRSVSLNAEMGVLFEHHALVAELQRRFEREKSPYTSYRVLLEQDGLHWEGEYEGSIRRFDHEPEASIWRRLLAGLVRYLPIESQL